MDRGRGGRARATKKRAAGSTSHAHQPGPEQPTSPSTPVSAPTSTTHRAPHTAPQRGGKAKLTSSSLPPQHRLSSPSADPASRVTPKSERPARSTTFPSTTFTFESPSLPGANMAAPAASSRKRAKTFELSHDGGAEDDAHSKGGHSLRKRARIDYTQEQIDDTVPATFKPDTATKGATTPGARNRKRKDSEDDFNDAANPKRRRTDKSPAPTRINAPRQRRRTESELEHVSQPQTEQGAHDAGYENQSDNGIHDSIVVGLSMDEIQNESGESDHSSSQDPESRPSTPEDSGSFSAPIQPATPQPPSSPQTRDAAAIASETKDANGQETLPHQANEAEMATHEVAIPSQAIHPDQSEETRVVSSELVSSKVSTVPQQLVDKPFAKAEHVPDATAARVPLPALKSSPLAPSPNRVLGSLEPAHPSPPSQAAADVGVPGTQSAGVGLATQLPRLGKLETIYAEPTPFGTELQMTPYYEEEEVRLPAPYLEKPKPAGESAIPTPTPTPSPVESVVGEINWDGRRLLKGREFSQMYRHERKRRQEMGEQPISMAEFYNLCVRKYKAAQSSVAPPPASDGPIPGEVPGEVPVPTDAPLPEATKKGKRGAKKPKRGKLTAAGSFEETPQSSLPSRQATAAPSPAPYDGRVEVGQALYLASLSKTEQEVDEAFEELAGANDAAEPEERIQTPATQYTFPKIRDPSEFIEALESYQDLDSVTLQKTVAAAVEALHVWEKEYQELRKIVDDEENAKRRLPNDKAIENWEKRQRPDEPEHFRRHFDENPKGPPPFELKGARVPKPYIDDPVLERQKDNDRVMAQAYGFKYSTHPAQVGRQNPEEQRWEMTERGLRDRKKTEKGAELAEENVIEGKRARKPRNLSDQSKEPSRSGTPALGVGRRVRRRPGAGAIQEDDEAEVSKSAPVVDEGVLAPVTRKRRGPRPRAQLTEQEVLNPMGTAPSVDANQTEDEGLETKQKVAGRKRALPPTSVPAETTDFTLKRQAPAKTQLSAEIASSSFYSNPSPANTQLESRPSTASSEATVHTVETAESAYSLRDKRKRNFALENDPELEPRAQKKARNVAAPIANQPPAEPKKRAPRKKNATINEPPQAPPPPLTIAPQPVGGLKAPAMFFNNAPPALAPAPGPFMHTFNATPAVFPPAVLPPPAPEPPATKKHIVRIKLNTNGLGSQGPSRTPTPANIAPNPAAKSTAKTARSAKLGTPSDAVPPQQLGPTNPHSGDVPDKPYAEMSKSEKMSYSMRRRWASGEMRGAVEKRRTTLANKKAEKAAGNSAPNSADPSIAGRTPDPSSAGQSGPPTPSLMPTQSGALAFPPPPQHLPQLQSIHLQQPLQQPMPMPQAHHIHQPMQQPMQQPMSQSMQQPMSQSMAQPMAQPVHQSLPLQQPLQQPPHMLQQTLPYTYQPRPGPLA